MNETYEQEIDLKWLIYRVLRAWRKIVVQALIIGVLIGIGSFGLSMLERLDPEYIAAEELKFNRAHASWVAEGENLSAEIESLEDTKAKQVEYNQKSVLMQINPTKEYNASFQLYMDYDYKINPELSVQDVDLSDRILKAYATYMTNGEMYNYILGNLTYELELHYLQEILTTDVDYDTHMISVSVRQKDETTCQEILGLAKEGLNKKFTDITASIAEHGLVVTNSTAYEAVNRTLDAEQKANIQYVSDLDIELQKKYEEYLDWKKEPEPQAEYKMWEVVKGAIKLFIIGTIVGGVLAAVVVAFYDLMSGKLLNPEDLKDRFGLRILGLLPTKRVKKPFAFISRWFCKFGGITATPEDFDRLAQMVGTNIKSDLLSKEKTNDWKKIAFAGTVSEEEICRIMRYVKMDASYTRMCAPDVLRDSESIETVMAADCVILVEKQEYTTMQEVERQLESLKAWNKKVVGVIVLNTDAVM